MDFSHGNELGDNAFQVAVLVDMSPTFTLHFLNWAYYFFAFIFCSYLRDNIASYIKYIMVVSLAENC